MRVVQVGHAPSHPPREQLAPLVEPGVVEPHASDMAVVASAEATLGDVDAALAEHRQWLPIDGNQGSTLRDLIDADSTGPMRLAFGGWRDRVTGVQFIDGRGDLVTVGGLPVKNVAGYDLAKLLVGSHGCFGRLVSVTVRTARRPTAALARTVPIDGGLPATVNRLITGDVPPSWLLLTAAGLRAGWLGTDDEVAVLADHVQADKRSFGEDATERLDASDRRVKLVVAPSHVAGLADDLANDPVIDGWAIDPMFGVGWLPAHAWEAGSRLATRRAGHATLAEGDGRTRCAGIGRETLEVLARLKREFDPDNALPPLPRGEAGGTDSITD